MKQKLLVGLFVLCMGLLSGCSKAQDPSAPSPPAPNLSSEIIQIAQAKDNVIGVNSIEADYDKDGNQKGMKLYLWALERQDESNDYWLELNIIVNDNGISAEKGQTLSLRTEYNPIKNGSMYDIDTFLKRFGSIDVKAIVEGYKVGEPAYFQLRHRERDMNTGVFAPDANTKYLALAPNSLHEIEPPAEFNAENYNMPSKEFYVLSSYYYPSPDTQDSTFYAKNFLIIVQDK